LELHKKEFPIEVFHRCHYVLSENDRLLQGCALLSKGQMESFGQLMFATHEGLSKEYAVSCEELDHLVEAAKQSKIVAGARMMGGGFGGCTINLVREKDLAAFEIFIRDAYHQRFNKNPEIYVTQIEDGAKRVMGD
jgi:galactokinase